MILKLNWLLDWSNIKKNYSNEGKVKNKNKLFILYSIISEIDSQKVDTSSITSQHRRKRCESCGGVSPLHLATSEQLETRPYQDVDLPSGNDLTTRLEVEQLSKEERRMGFYGFDGGGRLSEHSIKGGV